MCIEKVNAKHWPGVDVISNDIITLCMCFSMFVYIHACFRFLLVDGNLTAQWTGSHRGVGGGIPITAEM